MTFGPHYLPCGGSPYSISAAADTTGYNTGNLTNYFGVGQLGNMPNIFEWHRATITTQVPGQVFPSAPCSIYVAGKPASFTFPAGGTEWDPTNPIICHDGYDIAFYWALASSVTPVPYVTIWLRYDASIPSNRAYG